MGILEVLFVVFVILKLCAVIDWSWWWVASPLYPAAFIWLCLAILCVFAGRLTWNR